MKVICAPDSFKGSIDAVAAAAAMADGIRTVLPDVTVDQCPLGDGGEGTLRALAAAMDGKILAHAVTGLRGPPVQAETGYFAAGDFAFVESAAAIGMQTAGAAESSVMTNSSFGVGEMLLHACEQDPASIRVGLGGTATNDGGCGMAQALGIQFYDHANRLIESRLSGGLLQHVQRIDTANRSPVIEGVEILALCDVTNPLTGPDGAAAVFGPQKGATTSDVEQLDAGLTHLADVIHRDIGLDVSNLERAGAAGGLAAGLAAFAGARLVSGIDAILESVDFTTRLADATLCLTGEGRIDSQSLAGKTCIGVARYAAAAGVPVVALVGSDGPGAEACLDAGLDQYVVIGAGFGVDESMRCAASLLADSAARVAKQYLGKDDTINR